MTTIPKDRRFSASRVAAQNAGKRFIRAPGANHSVPTGSSSSARRFNASLVVGKSLEAQVKAGISQGAKLGSRVMVSESQKSISIASGVDGVDDASEITSSLKKGVSASSRFLGRASSPAIQKGREYTGRFAKKAVVRAGKAFVNKVSAQAAIKQAAKMEAAKMAAAEVGKQVTIKALFTAVVQGASVHGVAAVSSIKELVANPAVALGIIIALAIVALLGGIIAVVIYSSTYAFLIKNPLPDTQTSPFVRAIAPAAIQSGIEYDVLPSVIIAQAMLESGSGTSVLAVKANNLFGIKGMYNGQTYYIDTLEYTKEGVPYTVRAGFCLYPSWKESILDHGKFLSKPRYAKVRNEANFVLATQALYDAGYATDPEYAGKLQDLIRSYNLTQYDSGWGVRNGEQLSAYLASLPASSGKSILAKASTMLGWPYSQENASIKSGYTDCSFLSQTAYASVGVSLPRTAAEQAEWCVNEGYEITYDALQPGDLVFYSLSTTTKFRSVTHVAIYCGEGMVIEASSSLNSVVYRPIWGHSQIVCIAHPFSEDI